MNMKICIILILSLLSVTINTVAVTDCASATTDDLTITTGTTTDTASWDKVADCVAAIQGSAANSITNLEIIINSDVSSAVTKPINFASARFDPAIVLTITISNSSLTQANLSSYLYSALDSAKDTIGNIILTIDTAPLIADLVMIENWISTSKLDSTSSITINGSPCVVTDQVTLDACLVKNADAAAVTACSASDLIFIELTLTSNTPAEVNSCLSTLDVASAGGKLKKLTIDYTGVTTIDDANLDFATLLLNRKSGMTDLSLILKSTNYQSSPVLTGFTGLLNLTLNYSNNGIDSAGTTALVNSLKTAGDFAATLFEVTMSDSATDNNNFGNLKKLVPLTTASASTTIVNVYDRTQNCAFDSSNINDSDSCNIVVITPTISNDSPMVCTGYTVDISSDLANAENLNGISITTTNPAWSLDTAIAQWTLTAQDSILDLPTSGVTEQSYELTYSSDSVSDGTNNIPVIYEPVSFTVGPCLPEAYMSVNESALNSDKRYNNCEDLVIGIDESTITQGAVLSDTDTVYTWAIKQSDNTTVQPTADPKNAKTFTITKDEIATPGTYYITLDVTVPTIKVEDLEIIIESCPAIPHINGSVAKQSYTDCQDLVLSVGSYPGDISPTVDTTFSWTLMNGSQDVLSSQSPAIVPTTSTVTVPKAALLPGTYDATLSIASPSVRVDDFSITIVDGGSCGQNEDDTTDSSTLLQLSLALLLVLALIL